MEKSGLVWELDASSFTKGAKEVDSAVLSAKNSISNFTKLAVSSFRQLDTISRTSFGSIAREMSKLGSIRVGAGLSKDIDNLKKSLEGIGSPRAGAVNGLKILFSTLSRAAIDGTIPRKLDSISKSLTSLKAPSSTAIKNIKDLFNALTSLKSPPSLAPFIRNLGSLQASLQGMAGAANAAKSASRGLSFTNLGQQARSAGSGFSAMNQQLRVTNSLLSTLTFAGIARGIFEFGQAVFNSSASFTKFTATMTAAVGSTQKVNEAFGFVRGLSNTLGLPLQQTSEQFAKFSVAASAANVSVKDTRDIFTGISEALTATGATAYDTQLSFLALEQMMSKGKVSSEELRRQLGERLPGAVGFMAKALNVSTAELDKMLRMGQVLSADALPKFARVVQEAFGPGLAVAINSPVVALGRFRNSIYELYLEISNSGFAKSLAIQLNDLADSLNSQQFRDFAQVLGTVMGGAIALLGTGLKLLADNAYLVGAAFTVLIARNIGSIFTTMNTAVRTVIGSLGIFTAQTNAATVSNVALGTSQTVLVSRLAASRLALTGMITEFTLLRTQMGTLPAIASLASAGFLRFGTVAAGAIRGLFAAIGPAGWLMLGLTFLPQVIDLVSGALQRLGITSSTSLVSTVDVMNNLEAAFQKGFVSATEAQPAFDQLNQKLRENKDAASKAADAILFYRSVWTGFLYKHKVELDDTAKSVYNLAKKFYTGAISSKELADAVAKLDLSKTTEEAKALAERLKKTAETGHELGTAQDRLRTILESSIIAVKAAGGSTAELEKILSELGPAAERAGASIDRMSPKLNNVTASSNKATESVRNYTTALENAERTGRRIKDILTGSSGGGLTTGVKSLSSSAQEMSTNVSSISSSIGKTVQGMMSASIAMEGGAAEFKSFQQMAMNQIASYNANVKANPDYSSEFVKPQAKMGGFINSGFVWESGKQIGTLKTNEQMQADIQLAAEIKAGLKKASEAMGRDLSSMYASISDPVLARQKEFGSSIVMENERAINALAAKLKNAGNSSSTSITGGSSNPISSTGYDMGITSNTTALGSNTAALNKNTASDTNMAKLYDKLDLARKNVSDPANDPLTLWNSSLGSLKKTNGFSTGGSFTVGGQSGVDKNFMPMMLTKGEKVDITPAGQRRSGVSIDNITVNINATDYQSIVKNRHLIDKEVAASVKRAMNRGVSR